MAAVRQGRKAVALALVAGVILSLLTTALVAGLERDRAVRQFARVADGQLDLLHLEISRAIEAVRSLADLYAVVGEIPVERFRIVARGALSRQSRIVAFEWVPRVPVRLRGDLAIKERSETGALVPAGGRAEYFPVLFAESRENDEKVIGFDLASDPSRREALMRARDSGTTTVTSRITLIEGGTPDPGFLVVQPVYWPGIPPAAGESLEPSLIGFVVGVFRFDRRLEESAPSLPGPGETIDIHLFDLSAPPGNQVLSSSDPEFRDPEARSSGTSYSENWEIGGRQWLAIGVPGRQYGDTAVAWPSILTLVAGLMATTLVALHIAAVGRHQDAVRRWTLDLEAEHRRLLQAQQLAAIGTWEWDPREGTMTWSKELHRILGVPGDQFPTLDLFESLIHPEDRGQAASLRSTVLAEGVSHDHEFRIIRPDGVERQVLSRVKASPAEESTSACLRGIVQDVTEEREARYRAVVEHQTELICRYSGDGRLTFANDAFCHYFGKRRDEVVGSTWMPLIVDEDRSRVIDHLACLGPKRPWETIEFCVITSGGERRWQEWTNRVIPGGNGETFEIQGVGRDVTGRHVAEEQVRLLNEELERRVEERTRDLIREIEERRNVERERVRLETQLFQAQKMEALGQLAGGLAHDFNNLLAPIALSVQHVIDTSGVRSRARKHLAIALAAVDQARVLVARLLEYGRPSRSDRREIHLGQVLADAVELFTATAPATVTVMQDFAADVPPVLANPGQIHQLVMNLGTNAVQAMDGRTGTIRITLRLVEVRHSIDASSPVSGPPPGRYAVLTFADTGCGMDEGVLGRIFDPFFTTKSTVGNSGLGLAVAQRIVTDHNGVIMVESEPGRGTAFHIYLPADGPAKGVSTSPPR